MRSPAIFSFSNIGVEYFFSLTVMSCGFWTPVVAVLCMMHIHTFGYVAASVGSIAQWLWCRLSLPCARSMVDRWPLCRYTVCYGSVNLANSAFHPCGVSKRVVIHVFTWITEVETIKTANCGYMLLYGYRPKSVTAGWGCSLGRAPALSVTTAPLMRQFWHCINEP